MRLMDKDKTIRIQKILSEAGLCSRREAERLILQGRVKVNGKIIGLAEVLVNPKDKIELDNQPIKKTEAIRLWLYHKPVGEIVTDQDPEGRRTIYESLPESMPRVMAVGRLDLNSEGLLLLTNSPALKRYLELPSHQLERTYRVRVYGEIPKKFEQIKQGITIEDVHYQPISYRILQPGKNSWLEMTLSEGKNREIRRVMTHFGLQVSRLVRLGFGPFELGELAILKRNPHELAR